MIPSRILNRFLGPGLDVGSVQFFARDLNGALRRARPSTLTVRAASVDEIDRLLDCCHPARDPATLKERFGRGDQCFVAEDAGGRLMHTGWVTTSRAHIPELDLDVIMRAAEAYLYDAWAPPDRRGNGAFGLVLDEIFARLQAAGFSRAYSYVRGDNHYGLTSARRRLQPVARLWYVNLFGRSVVLGRRGAGLPELRRSAGRGLVQAADTLP